MDNGGLSTDGQVAMKDYQKYSSQLKDEISYLKFHYNISANATPDEYKTWRRGYGERLDLCRQMYNNTSAASKKYLPYLNNSSEEYRNVTSDIAIFQSDIESLNKSYDKYSDYLDLSIDRAAALEKYSLAMNETYDAYNDLTSFAGSAKVSSEEEYAGFLDGFDRRAQAFKHYADEAVKAGLGHERDAEQLGEPLTKPKPGVVPGFVALRDYLSCVTSQSENSLIPLIPGQFDTGNSNFHS